MSEIIKSDVRLMIKETNCRFGCIAVAGVTVAGVPVAGVPVAGVTVAGVTETTYFIGS